jgi:hypothetical protein
MLAQFPELCKDNPVGPRARVRLPCRTRKQKEDAVSSPKALDDALAKPTYFRPV